MKRAIFLALVATLLAAPALVAQQPPQPQEQPQAPAAKKPKPMDPADVETLTGRPYPQAEPEPAPKPGHALGGEPAPKKGHPLDWRDVDILTGKTDRSAQNGRYRGFVTPYVYFDVPVRGSRFGGAYFTGGSTRTSPLPRVFGRTLPNPATVIVP
jgi:hypothetical protein